MSRAGQKTVTRLPFSLLACADRSCLVRTIDNTYKEYSYEQVSVHGLCIDTLGDIARLRSSPVIHKQGTSLLKLLIVGALSSGWLFAASQSHRFSVGSNMVVAIYTTRFFSHLIIICRMIHTELHTAISGT